MVLYELYNLKSIWKELAWPIHFTYRGGGPIHFTKRGGVDP